MGMRVQLQQILEDLLGSRNVYYQPPENLKLQFPCIVYEKTPGRTFWADNKTWAYKDEYTVTLITIDPDSDLIKDMIDLPMCHYDRHFVNDNLNHDVFSLYY